MLLWLGQLGDGVETEGQMYLELITGVKPHFELESVDIKCFRAIALQIQDLDKPNWTLNDVHHIQWMIQIILFMCYFYLQAFNNGWSW